MLDQAFRDRLEDYHRRKWFPADYPDPLGEFADAARPDTVRDLFVEYRRRGARDLLFASFYIYEMLAPLEVPAVFSDFRKAMEVPMAASNAPPGAAFYWLRVLPPPRAGELWDQLRRWAEEYQSPLEDWASVKLETDRKFDELRQAFCKALGLNTVAEINRTDASLRAGLDLFSWELAQQHRGRTLPSLLQSFSLKVSHRMADWGDFPALARALEETWRIKQAPAIRKAELDASIQAAFPVLPPARVVVQHGTGAGPVDALRFVSEYARGCFFAGMNPDLPIEQRICGDPALAPFWGYLYALTFARPAGLRRFAGPLAADFSPPLQRYLRFWFRYDAMLSLYRHAAADSRDLAGLYKEKFAEALGLEIPDFLYLYDLTRTDDSLFRQIAFRSAVAAEDRLRELFGNEWYADAKWARRARDTWWEGYRLTLEELAADLGFEYCSTLAFY